MEDVSVSLWVRETRKGNTKIDCWADIDSSKD